MIRMIGMRLVKMMMLLMVTQTSCAWLSGLVEKPKLSLQRVDLTSISFDGLAANFVIGVVNPNPIGAKLARLGYQITIDGHQFAEGAGPSGLNVPAKGTGSVTLPVAVKWTELAQSLASLFTKTQVAYGLATKLGFDTPAGILTVPLSTNGTFPVPQLPDVSFSNASIGSVNASGAYLQLGLSMRNKNAFPIPIGNLNYAVAVQGVSVASGATSGTNLAASATQPVTLGVNVNFLQTGLAIARAVTSRSATVGLQGALDLGPYKMPLSLSRTLQ